MIPSQTHYELLGVSSSADDNTLRRAFRDLSKTLHPDTTSLPYDEAARRFQQVCEAYEILHDPISRQLYDSKLLKEVSVSEKVSVQFTDFSLKAQSKHAIGVRRPLSGGELFALLLLVMALVLSLLLGIGLAMMQGKELFVAPTWLMLKI